MKRRLSEVIGVIGAALFLLTGANAAPSPVNVPLSGELPVLVILQCYKDTDADTTCGSTFADVKAATVTPSDSTSSGVKTPSLTRADPAYYHRTIFGPKPSTRDYLRETSYGSFTIKKAALLGWKVAPEPEAYYWGRKAAGCAKCDGSGHHERKWTHAIQQADAEVDFSVYDKNGDKDGIVDPDELAIVIIEAHGLDGNAHARTAEGAPIPTKDDCPVGKCKVDGTITEAYAFGASFHTIAHELGHAVVALGDLYPDDRDDEQQSVAVIGNPKGGSFTLSLGTGKSAAIAFDAGSDTVRKALEAVSTIGSGNVRVEGGPLPMNAVTVTFQNGLARTEVAQMTAASMLTGGTSPTVVVTTVAEGWKRPYPMYSESVKQFSLMAYDGNHAHLDPWHKMKLGWLSPKHVTKDGVFTVKDAETNREAYILDNPCRPQEYFLVENRWPGSSYDADLPDLAGLPSKGLAIWHIDETQSDIREVITLERAQISSDSQALWSGDSPATSYRFDDMSAPNNSRWNDNKRSRVEIKAFSAAGPAMTVTFATARDDYDAFLAPYDEKRDKLLAEREALQAHLAELEKDLRSVPPDDLVLRQNFVKRIAATKDKINAVSAALKSLKKELEAAKSKFCAVPDQATNVALGKPATQSSTWSPGIASRAVDGNTSGNWAAGSVTHTNNDVRAWWEVDLLGRYAISSIEVWNRTDCCPERLADFSVRVSDDGVNWWTSWATGTAGSPTSIPVGRSGRYVRVQLSGTNHLSLAEVQVRSAAPINERAPAPRNLAFGKPATQSSTWGSVRGPAVASRAVDGNTSGHWLEGSVTHTNYEAGSWWQVDLQARYVVDSIEIWNRTDCCAERLTGFSVMISDDGSTWLSKSLSGTAQSPTSVPVAHTARYVRVQLSGTNYLALAEVQVWSRV